MNKESKLCECGVCGLPAPIAMMSNMKNGAVKGQPQRFVRGHSTTTHGHAGHSNISPEYQSWRNMIDRCTNPKNIGWKTYGGAPVPVLVCERWKSFENFLLDLGPRPEGTSLGRFCDMGNYEPGGCSWMTPAEQGLARRNHNALRKWEAQQLMEVQQ